MRLLLLALLSLPAFANFPAQIALRLDAGKYSYTITNSGSSGGSRTLRSIALASWARVGVVITPGVFVPPTVSTTYTDCADPCGTGGTASLTTFNMQLGKTYVWYVRLDSGGTPVSPFQMSSVGAAYSTQSCNSAGGFPFVEPPVTTTAPLPMPREVIGQDCYVDYTQLPLLSGHASSSVQYWLRVHSASYKTIDRADLKGSMKINSGSWIDFTNANAASSTSWSSGKIHRVDEARYYSRDDKNQFYIDPEAAFLNFGGYTQIADYLIDIPNGTISSGDTTLTQRFRFNGTESVGSGYRLIEAFPVEGTHCTITQIVVTNGVAVATCNNHGYSAGNDVVIWGAPMERRIFNGPRHINAVTTNTFTFLTCGAGATFSTGGSKSSTCAIADGTYFPPVNTDPVARKTTEQAYMYSARMLVAKSAFTYPDPASEAAPVGGDPVEGKCLFETSNACAGGSNVLVLPLTPWSNYRSSVNCSDCHAKGPAGFSGSDLKYYNFSNHSIEQRSYFHGLSQQDGLDIAAYIRGIPIPVPVQARPWNPPMQTGPGMADGTFKRFDSTLTSIVVSGGNLATVTTASAHNYSTGMWITTVLSSAGTVDTVSATKTVTKTAGEDFPVSLVAGTTIKLISIGTFTVASRTSGTEVILTTDPGDHIAAQYRANPPLGGHVNTITVTGATTFTYPTSGIANGTYTDTLLEVTNAHDFWAGCGIDCVSTYGAPMDMYPSMGNPGTDSANWGQAGFMDPRTVVYPYLFPDWNLGWLPAIHPNDSTPAADYYSSTPYLYLQTLYGATPGDLTSWAALDYGVEAGNGNDIYFQKYQQWYGPHASDAANTPPTKTDQFLLLENLNGETKFLYPGNVAPSLHPLFRQSLINSGLMGLWSVQVNYKVTGFSIPAVKDKYGSTAAAGCYPEWYAFDYGILFTNGQHKVVMGVNNVLQGNLSSWMYGSHIWYVAALGVGTRQCWDTPNAPIDLSYGQAYTGNITLYRAAPVATYLIWPILSSQAGHANPNAYKHSSPIDFGWDWTGTMYGHHFDQGATKGNRFGWWWLDGATDRPVLLDHLLDIINLSTAVHSTGYWETAFSNYGPQGTSCASDDYLCIVIRNDLTFATLYGATVAKVTALADWATSINLTEWNAMDFYAAIAAGTQGNADYGASGDLTTPAYNEIDFTSCPFSAADSFPYTAYVKGSGSANAEFLRLFNSGFGGNCVAGMPGKMFVINTLSMPGTLTVIYGLRNSPALFPNYDGDGFVGTNGAR